MLTSVYREIPDDSIEGTKIKDNTSVNYFNTVIANDFHGRTSTGAIRAYLTTITNSGYVSLKDESGTTAVQFWAHSSELSYFNNAIVFGNTTAPYSTSTYPTQVSGGFACSGASRFGLAVTMVGSLTVQSTCDFQDEVEILEGGLTVGTHNPSNTTWSTITAISSVVIDNTQWTRLAAIDQDLTTSDRVAFAGLTSTGRLGAKVEVNPSSFDTSTELNTFWVIYSGVLTRTITLDGTTSPTNVAGRIWIVQNNGTVATSVTITAIAGDFLNGSDGGSISVLAGETYIVGSRNSLPSSWTAIKIAGGATGTFTDHSSNTVTVTNGLITSLS